MILSLFNFLLLGLNCFVVEGVAREITLGVDYYPEQWLESEMIKDMRTIRDELGANTIRIGEFMWQQIESSDGNYNFTYLDSIIDNAESIGLNVMLGTPTATMPAWLATSHPDVLLKTADSPDGYQGSYAGFGGRRQYSFNSDTYIQYAERITAELAKRYGDRDIIKFWQVDNEIGHENSDLDFSDNSLTAWRQWLSDKYDGDIDSLNGDWGTIFWGTSYGTFDEIPLPKWTVPGTSPRPNEVWRSNSNPGMLLDFRRFRRDSITSFTDLMITQLRDMDGTGTGVKGEITTNAPGGFWDKALDHNDIFSDMDFAGYDNYPVWGGSTSAPIPSTVAIALDTVRGWKCNSLGRSGNVEGEGGESQCSWMVIEQLIGAQGHDIIGYTPRRGQASAWSMAALLAHGAHGLLFFRYRPALFGQEEYCYGVLEHSGEKGKKYHEAKDLFNTAKLHKNIIQSNVRSHVALLYDVENAYTWAAQPQSILFDFTTENHRLYYPFWRNGVAIDVLSLPHLLRELDAENNQALAAAELFKQYKVILLPVTAVVGGGDNGDVTMVLLRAFVDLGGSLWISFRSDLKDQRSQIRPRASRLAQLAGVEISEIESLNDASAPATLVSMTSIANSTTASVFREGLEPIRGLDVEVLFNYNDSFFGGEGYAAVTRRIVHSEGKGKLKGEVIYLGCGIEPEALVNIATNSLTNFGRSIDVEGEDESSVLSIPMTGIADSLMVEQVIREDDRGNKWRIAINHDEVSHVTSDGTMLKPYQLHVNRERNFP